jgi:hypothetical protein
MPYRQNMVDRYAITEDARKLLPVCQTTVQTITGVGVSTTYAYLRRSDGQHELRTNSNTAVIRKALERHRRTSTLRVAVKL